MNLDSLRCFVSVAETLHFRDAAERVALSPAAVSSRIRQLEDELGCTLFNRTTRQVLMTDAGTRLLPHARRMLEDAQRCADVARGDDRPLPYALTIGTRYELGLSWLSPAIGPLAEARPERTLHLHMGDTDALMERLERRVIDACVLSARITQPHIRYSLLHPESYAFVSAGPGPRTAEDARLHTLIDVSPDLPLLRYLLDALPDGTRWRFRDLLFMGGIGGVRLQVLAGMGVAVLPRYFVQPDLDAGRMVELLPDAPIRTDHFRLLWRADHHREPAIIQLAEQLRGFPLR